MIGCGEKRTAFHAQVARPDHRVPGVCYLMTTRLPLLLKDQLRGFYLGKHQFVVVKLVDGSNVRSRLLVSAFVNPDEVPSLSCWNQSPDQLRASMKLEVPVNAEKRCLPMMIIDSPGIIVVMMPEAIDHVSDSERFQVGHAHEVLALV